MMASPPYKAAQARLAESYWALNDRANGAPAFVRAADLLPDDVDKSRDGQFVVTVAARYIERGADRTGGGRYTLSYRWVDGGLLGGKSLRLTGLNRA